MNGVFVFLAIVFFLGHSRGISSRFDGLLQNLGLQPIRVPSRFVVAKFYVTFFFTSDVVYEIDSYSISCALWSLSRSLFANSALNMIKACLDQPRQDNMRILGCQTLVDFIRVQVHNSFDDRFWMKSGT